MSASNEARTGNERFEKGWEKEIDGCTREELTEVLMMTAVYSGFPAALNAFATFGSVLQSAGSPCAGQA